MSFLNAMQSASDPALTQNNFAAILNGDSGALAKLRAAGWTGTDQFGGAGISRLAGGMDNQYNEITPEFSQWLSQNGYKLGGDYSGGASLTAGVTDAKGNPIASSRFDDSGGLFDYLPAIGSLALLGGAAAGALPSGGAAAGTGAATGTGAGVAAADGLTGLASNAGWSAAADSAAANASLGITGADAAAAATVPSGINMGSLGGVMSTAATPAAVADAATSFRPSLDSQLANQQLGLSGADIAATGPATVNMGSLGGTTATSGGLKGLTDVLGQKFLDATASDLATSAGSGAASGVTNTALQSAAGKALTPSVISSLLKAGVSAAAITALSNSGSLGGNATVPTGGASPAVAYTPAGAPTVAQLNTSAPTSASNPNIANAASTSGQISGKLSDQAAQTLAQQQAQIGKVTGTADTATAGQMQTAAQQAGISDLALSDYTGTYRPVAQALANQSMTMDDKAHQDAAAGAAAADTQRSIDAALAGQRRSMANMGVNPGNAAIPERADLIRSAAAKVAAGNVARRNLVTDANALRGTVAQMGNTALNTSLNAGNSSSSNLTSAVNTGTVPFNMTGTAGSNYTSGQTAASGANTAGANINLSALGTDLSSYNAGNTATQQNNDNMLKAWTQANQNSLDTAKLGETQRQFNTDASLRATQINNQASYNNAAGVGSLVKFGVDNWDKIGKIGSDLSSVFGG